MTMYPYELEAAKKALQDAGYVVIKATSHRRAQERQRIAQVQRDMEIERRESVERWAQDAFAEQRRLSERLTFVWGIACAHGATSEELVQK